MPGQPKLKAVEGGTSVPDLATYAKSHAKHHGGKSWMESLPPDILEQCKEGWRNGLRATLIYEWLVAQGFEDASTSRVGWLATNH